MLSRQEFALVEAARELHAVVQRIGPHGPWEFRGENRLRTALALDHVKGGARTLWLSVMGDYVVCVTGSRDWVDQWSVYDALERTHHSRPIDRIVHGGARGADELADDWAKMMNVATTVARADWMRYGKKAGPMRNEQMLVTCKPDLVIAFPLGESKGTRDCMRRARSMGIEVWEPQGPRDDKETGA